MPLSQVKPPPPPRRPKARDCGEKGSSKHRATLLCRLPKSPSLRPSSCLTELKMLREMSVKSSLTLEALVTVQCPSSWCHRIRLMNAACLRCRESFAVSFRVIRASLVSAAEALRRSRACERRKSPEHCEVLRSLCEALSSQSSERRLLSWRPEMPKYSDKCVTLTKWRHGYQYCKDPKGLKSLHQAKGQEDGLFSSSRASLCVSASWLKPELAACARSDGRQ